MQLDSAIVIKRSVRIRETAEIADVTSRRSFPFRRHAGVISDDPQRCHCGIGRLNRSMFRMLQDLPRLRPITVDASHGS
jgi:hypothetical protein